MQRLETDVRGQVDAFRGFNEQQARIEELEGRIKTGQGRAMELGERLEECRRKAEAWEKREREWQARTSSEWHQSMMHLITSLTNWLTYIHVLERLNAAWVALALLVLCVILFLILRRLRRSSNHANIDIDGLRSMLQNSSLPSFAKDDLAQVISARLTSSTASSVSHATALPSDTRLAALDEL